MKRFVFFCIILVAIITSVSFLFWHFKTEILANTLSKQLKVPVTIESLDLSKNQINISQIFIGSVPQAKTPVSFQCNNINIQTNLYEIQSSPTTIDRLEMDNITIGLEYFSDGSTNWSIMLSQNSNTNTATKPFQINTLVLNKITVIITKPSGQVTRYPTIPQLVLTNINSTDQPIEEIEKAIFKIILQNVMQKLNILFNPQKSPILNPLQNLPSW